MRFVIHPPPTSWFFNFIENLIPRHFSNNAIFHSAQFSSGKVQLCAIHWKNGGKIRRISTFFVSTDQNSALSLVAPCSVCQEKLKFVIVDSSTRRSNSIIIEFLFNFQNKQDHMGCLFNWVLPYLVLKRKQANIQRRTFYDRKLWRTGVLVDWEPIFFLVLKM